MIASVHQKRPPALCWLGLLGMIFPLVGVCRLAKPGSACHERTPSVGRRVDEAR